VCFSAVVCFEFQRAPHFVTVLVLCSCATDFQERLVSEVTLCLVLPKAYLSGRFCHRDQRYQKQLAARCRRLRASQLSQTMNSHRPTTDPLMINFQHCCICSFNFYISLYHCIMCALLFILYAPGAAKYYIIYSSGIFCGTEYQQLTFNFH